MSCKEYLKKAKALEKVVACFGIAMIYNGLPTLAVKSNGWVYVSIVSDGVYSVTKLDRKKNVTFQDDLVLHSDLGKYIK